MCELAKNVLDDLSFPKVYPSQNFFTDKSS